MVDWEGERGGGGVIYVASNALGAFPCLRQAKLLVSRRHAFSTKNCVSPAGRVCVYSSLILSTFFLLFFSSSIAVFSLQSRPRLLCSLFKRSGHSIMKAEDIGA